MPGLTPLKADNTARSTRLTMLVSMVPGCRWFWLLSTPMARMPPSLAACMMPKPVVPAALKTTSTPCAICALVNSAPRGGSVQAALVVPVIDDSVCTLGLTWRAPCS